MEHGEGEDEEDGLEAGEEPVDEEATDSMVSAAQLPPFGLPRKQGMPLVYVFM